MLDALRRGASGIIAKGLFALLVFAFAIWGIPHDFLGPTQQQVAKVGGQSVGVTDFQRSFQNELERLSSENDRRISAEEARLAGVDRSVLTRLVGQRAISEHAASMKLAISDSDLAEGIRKDDNFAGPDGKFSKPGFEEMLRQMGLSEAGFFALRREDELREQLTGAMIAATVVPKPLVEIAHDWAEEERKIAYVRIDPTKISVPEPDEAKLKAYYEANGGEFMTPEYRKLGLLVLTPDDLKKDITIPEEEIKASYEDTKDTYDSPERRRVQQIAFKDRATAEAARKTLLDGTKNFMDVAKVAGAKESDVNLGMLSKKQLIDPKIADAAFALQRDAVSDIIDGRFATVILRVIEIEAGKTTTYDQVKDKVREKLAVKKAEGLIHDRFELVEEARNSGKPFKEIGQELKITFFDIPATDRDNKTADGQTSISLADAATVLDQVFSRSVGSDGDAVELAGNGYAWIDLQSVTPAAKKPFEAVQADVKTAAVNAERARLAKEMADKLTDRLKAGEDIAKVATDAGGTAETVDEVKRNTSPPGITQEAVRLAFSLPQGGAGSALTSDRATRTVFRVEAVKPAHAVSGAEEEKLSTDIKREMQNDLLIAYVATLQERLGVTINEKNFKRVTGADVE